MKFIITDIKYLEDCFPQFIDVPMEGTYINEDAVVMNTSPYKLLFSKDQVKEL